MKLYKTELGENYLEGSSFNTNLGVGTKFLFTNLKKNFNFYIGIEGKIHSNSINNIEQSEYEGIRSINGLDISGYTISLTTGIQIGGRKSDGDYAYAYMHNNDFISAKKYYESFLAKAPVHIKRNKAFKMLEYCQTQIPFQQVKLCKKSNFPKFRKINLSKKKLKCSRLYYLIP